MWILKLKSVDSEVKSVDSEAKKCGFVKKNSHFFYCLLPKVWFKYTGRLLGYQNRNITGNIWMS